MSKPGVHIIPVGLEYDRVIKPLFKDFTVQKAYLLIHDTKSNKRNFGEQQKAVTKFLKSIKQVPIEWEEIYLDIYDFNETFKTVYKLINRESRAGNPVYINISSAPKILQMALTMAALLNKEHGDVELFYVEPERYYEGELIDTLLELTDKKADEKKIVGRLKELAKEIETHGMAAGESRIHEFPPFPIADITKIESDMLGIIKDKNEISRSDIENISQSVNESSGVNSIKEMKELLDRKIGHETPRSNVKYYLDNLQKMGLIKTERDKKELKIQLTKVGELFADAKSD
jgi:hypothetical protein